MEGVVEPAIASHAPLRYLQGSSLAGSRFGVTSRRRIEQRLEDQEVAVLWLHLLQICLVYINTLMIQEVLSDASWSERFTEEDVRGLTPLLYGHVNPYGRFELDMSKRLPLSDAIHTT